MTDKEKIRVEIEKLISRRDEKTFLGIEKNSALKEVLSFIDSLQEEPVSEVWHDANETPKGDGDKKILVQFTDSHASVLEIDDWEYLDHQTKWAYLKDLT